MVLKRELRRVTRAARVVCHLLAGVFAAHVVFALLDRLPHASAEPARRALARWWSRHLCRILRLKVQVAGEIAATPALLVANHVSWLDIPCLLATVDAVFVAKQEVAAWPLIGAMAARAGTIFLPRGGRAAASTAADAMTWRLARRRSVVMFPEGTTTDGTSVGPFHARLFQAAIRTQSVVQAIAVRYADDSGPSRVAPFIGDDDLLNHLWKLLAEKQIAVRLVFCPPQQALKDRRSLAGHARRQVGAVLTDPCTWPDQKTIRA